MTTGYLEIRLGDCTISGNFINGIFRTGVVNKPKVTYRGTFDDNQFLHGDNCEEFRSNFTKRGKFENGYLIEGTYICGQDFSEGTFERGNLIRGTYISNGIKYEGEFKYGKLVKGIIHYPTETHQGHFVDGKLRDGIIVNSDKTFCAKITFDGTDLKECYVSCACRIEKLNSLQLTLLCCTGIHCQEAYQFYKTHFVGKSAKKIITSKINDNIHVSFNNILGYQQIRENIDKYLNYDIHDVPPITPCVDIFNYELYNSHD